MRLSHRKIRIAAALIVAAGLGACAVAIFSDRLGVGTEGAGRGLGWKQIALLVAGLLTAAVGGTAFARPQIVSRLISWWGKAEPEDRRIRTAALVVLLAGLIACILAIASDALGLGTEGSGERFGSRQIFLLAVGAIALTVGALLLSRPRIVSRRVDWERLQRGSERMRAVVRFLPGAVTVHWARILALSALAFAAYIAVYYAGQPIVEVESFRQSLTADTTYWMIKEGWQIPYQTPAWGYPWTAPIEFPIYQSLVALITSIGHFPLEPVGRLVGFSFLIACAWPAFLIGKRLNLPPEAAWLFCALLWSSPLYLFWGRTFMIDTAAVFFTLAAIPYLLDLRGTQPPWRSAILGTLWATLAMLQRSITAGPVLLVLGIVLFAPTLRRWRQLMPLRRLASLALALGLPLIIGTVWTLYADSIKSDNFVGRDLTLGFRLGDQYLGTVGQRLDPGALKEIFWDRILEPNAAGFLGIALLVGALLSGQRSVRELIAVCLVLAALPIVVFFGVSLFLEYYQVSSVIFLIAALTLSCVLWIPSVISWRYAVPVVGSLLVAANLFNFWIGPGQVVRAHLDATQNRTLAIGDVIKRYTPEDSGIIVFGLYEGLASFDPEIAYFSQRKGFTVPDSREHDVEQNPASYLGGKELGAIIFCSADNKERYNRIIAHYAGSSEPHLFDIQGCHVWLPDTQAVVLPDGARIKPTHFLN